MDLLGFASDNKRISYAASFGIDEVDENAQEKLRKYLPHFKAISVREDAGKKIIEGATGIEDVQVVLDPTMLVEKERWTRLEERPDNAPTTKYVLAYFLGDGYKEQIKRYCKKNGYEFIDYYQKNANYGPSEFLYLIHHADLIITDSFHGSVFSILFERPFFFFFCIEKSENNNMLSRINTLLATFGLQSQLLKGDIENANLEVDYDAVNTKLSKERAKSINFLKRALDVKD